MQYFQAVKGIGIIALRALAVFSDRNSEYVGFCYILNTGYVHQAAHGAEYSAWLMSVTISSC